MAQSSPTFDVASVKQNSVEPSSNPQFTVLPGGHLTIVNVPLREIIRTAYEVQDGELTGGPGWIRQSRYDVEAKAEGMPPFRFPPSLSALEHPVYPMLRAMLQGRFKLVVHHETRSLPMYALVRARPDGTLGPQLHPSTTVMPALGSEAAEQMHAAVTLRPVGVKSGVKAA
jgi:uncharacterized protein (TIGR03435 family)